MHIIIFNMFAMIHVSSINFSQLNYYTILLFLQFLHLTKKKKQFFNNKIYVNISFFRIYNIFIQFVFGCFKRMPNILMFLQRNLLLALMVHCHMYCIFVNDLDLNHHLTIDQIYHCKKKKKLSKY